MNSNPQFFRKFSERYTPDDMNVILHVKRSVKKSEFLKFKKVLELPVDIAMYVFGNKHIAFLQLISKQNVV